MLPLSGVCSNVGQICFRGTLEPIRVSSDIKILLLRSCFSFLQGLCDKRCPPTLHTQFENICEKTFAIDQRFYCFVFGRRVAELKKAKGGRSKY